MQGREVYSSPPTVTPFPPRCQGLKRARSNTASTGTFHRYAAPGRVYFAAVTLRPKRCESRRSTCSLIPRRVSNTPVPASARAS